MKKIVLFFSFAFCFSLFCQQDPTSVLNFNGRSFALILVNNEINDTILLNHDIQVNSKIGNIWTVDFPTLKYNELQNINGIEFVEFSTIENVSKLKNDIEIRATKVDKVHNGLQNGLPKNYTGKGVIVGIVDVGFQNNHPTFFNQEGTKNRITRYWNQSAAGTPPSGYSYGNEFSDTTSIINANDLDGTHGTHVAGIAAGSGLGSKNFQFKGVAPEAELVFVSIKYRNDTLAGSALGDYVVANPCILDAYKYIFDYAQSVGKPAVINLSWGMHTGSHDGNSLFDKATELLVGKGRVLVGANGNDGTNNMHISHSFNKDTINTLMIENSRERRTKESVYADFWGSKNSVFSMQVSVLDTNLNTIAQTPFVNSTARMSRTFVLNDSFKIVFKIEPSFVTNQKPNITVSANNPQQSLFIFRLSFTSDTSTVHGWNSGASRDWTSGSFANKWGKWNFDNIFMSGNSDYTAGENGGTSKAVISVGAMAARSSYINIKGNLRNDSGYVLPGKIAPFSSRGPTVDGRIKPNIVAPGFRVPSAINNLQFPGWKVDDIMDTSRFRGKQQIWAVSSGTSMAAPHIAGIVALILQANPNLNQWEIKNILESTATQDDETGAVPNNTYGYGKVNALEAVKKAYQILNINASLLPLAISIYPNPALNNLQISLPESMFLNSIEIISANGKSVLMQNMDAKFSKDFQFNISELNAGIYVVKIPLNGEVYFYKFMKY